MHYLVIRKWDDSVFLEYREIYVVRYPEVSHIVRGMTWQSESQFYFINRWGSGICLSMQINQNKKH
jgi:hypothetical protein